jgi:hypothetical protein
VDGTGSRSCSMGGFGGVLLRGGYSNSYVTDLTSLDSTLNVTHCLALAIFS